MKRGSAIVLFFFACFGMWVPHGLAARDLKPDWFVGGGGTWGPGGARGGGCSSWTGCWTWPPSTPSPVTPSPPSSTPVSPTIPTPPSHKPSPSPVTPSPPSSTPVSPTTPTPPVSPTIPTPPVSHKPSPSPPVQKQPPSPTQRFANPIQCGMGYADMNACMGQYYASGGLHVSQECCTIMKETKQYCSYLNVNFFDVLENVCH